MTANANVPDLRLALALRTVEARELRNELQAWRACTCAVHHPPDPSCPTHVR